MLNNFLREIDFGLGLACQAKGQCYHTKKKRIKVRSTTCHYATKQRPVQITMYLGLDIIIRLTLQQILIDVQY